MAVVNYLLPLQLGECSNNGIICREGICYLKVGRTYTNPIISDKSVPDPTVVRANDGHFTYMLLKLVHTGCRFIVRKT